jgi:hypothetical protein
MGVVTDVYLGLILIGLAITLSCHRWHKPSKIARDIDAHKRAAQREENWYPRRRRKIA